MKYLVHKLNNSEKMRSKREKLNKRFRTSFISGLILLAPIGITYFVFNFLVQKIGAPTSELILLLFPGDNWNKNLPIWALQIFSTVFVIILITILGWLSQKFIGKFLVNTAEQLLNRLPFINTVYNTVKQIVETFSHQKKAVFQKVVMVEFPRKGTYAIGFLTGEGREEIQIKTDELLYNIFIPTTPNPTSGFLILAPKSQVFELEMPVADGMKFIISGGAVVPVYNPETNEVEKFKTSNSEMISSPVYE